MKILKAYFEGFKRAFASSKVVTVIYSITLMIGLAVAASFSFTLNNAVGNRPEVFKLLNDFDFMIYSDLMNNYGELIRPFLNQIIWFGMFYFFYTIFFAGGVLSLFNEPELKSKVRSFFSGSAKYFFRFLRLGIYVLIVQVIIFALIALIFGGIFNSAKQTSNEPELFTILVVWILTHILFFIFISIVSDYAKIMLVKEDSKKVWRTLRNAFKFSVKKIYAVYPLYLLLLIIPVFLIFVYFWIDAVIGMRSMWTLFIMTLIQQLFIWARLFTKVWILGSEYQFFNTCITEKIKPLLTQEILMNGNL